MDNFNSAPINFSVSVMTVIKSYAQFYNEEKVFQRKTTKEPLCTLLQIKI